MNRHQIRKCQCTIHLLITGAQLLGILNNRNRACNSLISASGIDYNWKFTAAHTRIGTGCRHGTGTITNLVSICIEHHLTDARTIRMCQAFFCDRHVAIDLMIENRSHILYLTRHCEIPDVFHIQKAAVGQTLFLISLHDRLQQLFTVVLFQHDIRVIVGNPHLCRILSGNRFNDDIEHSSAVQVANLHICLLCICLNRRTLFIADLRNHFKSFLRPSGYKSRSHRCSDSLHTSGVRHND